MLKNRLNKDEGFTLVELLIVIAIIGVLAAIAIPVFLSQIDKADAASVKSDANTIAKYVAAEIADGIVLDDTTVAASPYTFAADANGTTVSFGNNDDLGSITTINGVSTTLTTSDDASTFCVTVTSASSGAESASAGPGCA